MGNQSPAPDVRVQPLRIPRVYCPPPLQPGSTVDLDARATRHLSRALRLRSGDTIILFDGSGTDFTAKLARCDRKACAVQVVTRQSVEPEVSLRIHLGLGISRGERMDFAIQKSVELGASAITPLLTARNVVRLDADRRKKRLAHWQGILLSACEQSGRSRLPVLHPPTGLSDWLVDHQAGLLLDHRARSSLCDLSPPDDVLHLLVGPEGGLAAAERNQAAAAGFTSVRLGPRVMRTETAPLAALAAIQVLWGDLR